MRSCFKCGAEFHGTAERVCRECRRPANVTPPFHRALSFREKQVVALVSQGKRNKQIAAALILTEGTVKEYLNRIFKKAEVSNRTELAIWYTRQNAAPAPGANQIPTSAESPVSRHADR